MKYGLIKNTSITSGGTLTILPTDIYDIYTLNGTVSLSSNFTVTTSGSFLDGSEIKILYLGDVTLNTYDVVILGTNLPDDLASINCLITATYHNSAWHLVCNSNLMESSSIPGGQIGSSSIPASALEDALDFSSKTVSNGTFSGVSIDSDSDIAETDIDVSSGKVIDFLAGSEMHSQGSKLTLPTSATTLVGDDTADTLTNKTIEGADIDGGAIGSNTPVTEATIDNIKINGNTISSTDTNGDINLTPNGTGKVALPAAISIDGTDLTVDASELNALDGYTGDANDLNILAGASTAGLTAADLVKAKGFDDVVEVSGNDLVVAVDKMFDIQGGLKENANIITSGVNSLDTNYTYVFAHLTADSSADLPDAATCTGKEYVFNNTSPYKLTITSSGSSDFIDYNFNSKKTELYLFSPNSIRVVSNGTDWEVISRSGGNYVNTDGVRYGYARTKLIYGSTLTNLLDSNTQEAIPMNAGDVILSVNLYVGTVSSYAESIDVGADSALIGAAADTNGFIELADSNAVGKYESNDVAGTYAGLLIANGYFICQDDGFVTISATADISGSALTGSLVVTYIPA